MENKFYKQQGDEYIAKKDRLVSIIGLLIFVGIAVYFFIDGAKHDGVPYWVFPLFPIALVLYQIGLSAKLNLSTKMAAESWFGIKLKEYHFNSVSRFIVVKKTVNLISAGYGASIAFKTAGKEEKEIAFAHFKKKEIAEEFLAETQRLMK